MARKLSVLRACRRVLRPGGRLAFFTIFPAPGLSDADYQRALRSGPNQTSTRGREHRDLLLSAGFTEIAETDLSAEFLQTARAWYDGRKSREAELRAVEGDSVFDERQNDSSAQLPAIEAGLLCRALFVAS